MRKLKIHLILNPLLGIIPLGAVKIIFPFWIWFSGGSTFDVNLTFLGFERKSNVKIFFDLLSKDLNTFQKLLLIDLNLKYHVNLSIISFLMTQAGQFQSKSLMVDRVSIIFHLRRERPLFIFLNTFIWRCKIV